MSKERRQNPQQKKELSFKKDHISPSEYPHAFRKQWPAKKANAERTHRRNIKQQLQSQNDPEEDLIFEKREIVRKWGSISLGVAVENRLSRRLKRIAWNLFKTPYQAHLHREKFAAVLKNVIQGRSTHSVQIALYLQELLDAKQPWLCRFLQDEPQLQADLQQWIKDLTDSTKP